MMTKTFSTIGLILLFSLPVSGQVKDYDGNTYKTAIINNQEWMAENLNVSHFRNGDPILHAKTDEEWKKAGKEGTPAWCYMKNDASYGKTYGKLYNWHAVADPRGLAPKGWRVPSYEEWIALREYAGNNGGKKLKEAGTEHWEAPNKGANNKTGFTGIGGGYRYDYGIFFEFRKYGKWWSSSETSLDDAWSSRLKSESNSLSTWRELKTYGLSVRCLKGERTVTKSDKLSITHLLDQDNNIYKTVAINNQLWMAENLNVSHFRNGDPIPEVTSAEEWIQAGWDHKPAWCYYDNLSSSGKFYGKLYNGYAVTDPRGLAPEGWHVPSEQEWNALIYYLDGRDKAGGRLKQEGTTHWASPNVLATDAVGFNALPGGGRNEKGLFGDIKTVGLWWTSSSMEIVGDAVAIYHLSDEIETPFINMANGFSVRCVKD